MARITESEFKRLASNLSGKAGRAAALNDAAPARRRKGRDRLARVDYCDEPVVFQVSLGHDPRPKERPRTVVDLKVLESAFMSARGNLAAFRAILSRQGTSRTFTPKGTKEYEDLISVEARKAMRSRAPLKCPVEVNMTFILKGDQNLWPTSPADGDGDNLEKAVLDALNKVVFEDDRQVVRSTREKRCGPEPQLLVSVAPARP